MSTKTTFKRVALVAVAALGFGMLSSVPSQAVMTAPVFLDRVASTIDVDASGSDYSAVALNAITSTTAPGSASTENSLLTGAVQTLTAPVGSSLALRVQSAAAWVTTNTVDLVINGVVVSSGATVGTTTQTAASAMTYTVPNAVGTYSAFVRAYSTTDGTKPAANMLEYPFTLTIVASSIGTGADFGNAAATDTLHVKAVGTSTIVNSGRVGLAVGFQPNFTVKNGTSGSLDSNSKSANLNYTLTIPAGTAGVIYTTATGTTVSKEQTVLGRTETLATTVTGSSSTKGSTVYFTPATAGSYTVTVWHDANRDDLVSVGETSSTTTFTVAADAQPSITFTKYGSNTTAAQSADNLWGQLVKVSLRNGTTAWALAANETLVLTPADQTTDFLAHSTYTGTSVAWTDVASGISTLSLTSANFNGSGDAFINIGNTAAAGGTFSIGAVITGGTANGASGSFTITTTDTDTSTPSATAYTLVGNSALAFSNANSGLGVDGLSATEANASRSWAVKLGVATTVSAKVVSGANNYKLYNALVTDTLGLLTGAVGAKYNVNATTATTGALATSTSSLSVAIPATTAALTSGATVATMVIDANADRTITITANSATVSSVSVDPTDLATTTFSLRAGIASTNKFTAYVWDNFGNAVAGAVVTAQVTSGRNVQALATTLISDANGAVTFSVADTYTGTLLNTDTVKLISNSNEGVITVNYAAYNAASTVAITGGASADVAPAVTYSSISTAVAGASGATVKMTATVKDANGATLPAGIPVKWAISGLTGKSAILVDTTTGYDWSTSMTNSNGEAITYVYAWANGTVSVTATAGTVTSATAGKINFINAAADARVVSATADANGVITAKVVDRYGNGVKGVSITATRTAGTGYFGGNAASSSSGETNASGTVDFIVVGGEATVTIATTTLNAGQTSSAAGYVGATVVTATGIGASLAPVGVQSVSLTVAGNTATLDQAQAATDAAAEATDAANAATDAANAAAEAADAATAAAQDAADAVAALSTQVSEMVDALKKQITALTNLVIKIQKKVKA